MTGKKASTERIQRVYASSDSAELTSEYNRWSTEYDADLDALGYNAPRGGAELLATYIADKSAPVLDAGAGTGMVGEELNRVGFERITALDMSPGMLAQAEQKSVYEQLVIGELGQPLSLETDAFAGVTCIGVLTFGHAPPAALDELVRVTRAGGAVVFSMRTDYYTEGGFDVRQSALEAAGKWRLLQRSEPFQAMPDGEPDIWHELWAYEVL